MAKKAEAVKKGAVFNRAGRFFREVALELKKVHWPTRRQLMVYTGVVLVAIAFMGVLTWLVDSFLTWAMSLVIR